MPADTDALSGLPVSDAFADGVDASGNFVTGDAGILLPRPNPFLDADITVADATGFHFDAHLRAARLRDAALHNFEVAVGFCYLHCLHGSHFLYSL